MKNPSIAGLGKELYSEAKGKIDLKVALYVICCLLMSRLCIASVYYPLGYSLFCSIKKKRKMMLPFVFFVVGIFLGGGEIYTLKYFFASLVVILYREIFEDDKPFVRSLISGGACLGGSIVFMIFSGFSIMPVMQALIEAAAVSFICLYLSEHDVFYDVKNSLSKENALSVIFITVFSLGGIYDLILIGSVSPVRIIWYALIMIFSVLYGFVGALASGVMCGICASLFTSDPLSMIGIFSVCGFVCALVNKKGVIPTAIAFLVTGSAAALRSSLIAFDEIGVGEMVIASVLFVVFSAKIPNEKRTQRASVPEFEHSRPEIISQKFGLYSRTFLSVADTITKLSNAVKKSETDNDDEKIRSLKRIYNFRIGEDRKILTDQLTEFSKLLLSASDLNVYCDEKSIMISKRIVKNLRKKNISASAAYVYDHKDGWPEIEIRLQYLPDVLNTAITEAVVSDVCGLDMRISYTDERECIVRLEKQSRFSVISSISSVSKSEDGVCGDSCSVFSVKNNRHMIILSDGMGYGREANERSGAVCDIAKRMINAGFDKEHTLKFLSGALMMSNPEEMSATVDMAEIDLTLGTVSVLKAGGVKSYILRKNEIVPIYSESLPIGILSSQKTAALGAKLFENDYFIMISDGVDIPDKRMCEVLKEAYGGECESISKLLLSEAIKQSGRIVKDDMTVIVSGLVSR